MRINLQRAGASAHDRSTDVLGKNLTKQRHTTHVMVVVGTRPEAIKLAPLVLALRSGGVSARVTLLSTGQHREMLRPVFELFGLEPDVDLDLQRPDQTLDDVVSGVVARAGAAVAEHRPDVLVVQGDTSTAFAAGLAAFHHRVPVAHVEAGLRTDDPTNPFPEEMNRRLVSRLATLHYAPTERAARALRAEGVADDRIHVTGNTVIDALFWLRDQRRDRISTDTAALLGPLGIGDESLVVVTGHRRESFGEPLRRVCRALRRIADENEDLHLVYPVHLNPNVQGAVHETLGDHPRIHLVAPVGYTTMVGLLERATIVISDSGGIQEEAPSFGAPVLVTRDTTERPEGVEAGVAHLVGTDDERIVERFRELRTRGAGARPDRESNPYGDGRACERIVRTLLGEGSA
jgi:UDP-N-acetylglucosamine 2-epimerase